MAGAQGFRGLIPVFLPGNQRNFDEIRGVAEIDPNDGEIKVKLQHKEHAERLVEMARKGQIISLSFDYLAEGKENTPGV